MLYKELARLVTSKVRSSRQRKSLEWGFSRSLELVACAYGFASLTDFCAQHPDGVDSDLPPLLMTKEVYDRLTKRFETFAFPRADVVAAKVGRFIADTSQQSQG